MSAASPSARLRADPGARLLRGGTTLRLCRRELAEHRRRTAVFAALCAAVAYVQPVAYRHAYPTTASRESFARSFGTDKAIRLFYGVPHDLLSVGGYTAWRVGSVLAVVAGIWGAIAAATSLRGEEDTLRAETVLALPVTRLGVLRAAVAAIAVQASVLVVGIWVALVAGGLALGASLFLAVTVGSVALVFVGVGALASQLVATRRRAVELSVATLVVTFAVRVVADTTGGAGWLRWLSPLGWAEQMRAFAHPAPGVLLLPVLAGAALLVAAASLGRRRDIGTGLWPAHDSHPPRRWGLRTPEGFALRNEISPLAWWLVGTGGFALLVGTISKTVSAAGIPPALRRELARAGAGSVTTPTGYLGFTFLIFVLALSLFACSQISAARHEELGGRLETLAAGALARQRWLRARLAVAAVAVVALALVAAGVAWAGARAAGALVPLGGMLLAAGNCAGVATLFLGLGALAYALLPRAAASVAYGLVVVTFLWQLFGPVLGSPHWLLDLSPFAHLGLAPARPFRLGPIALMAAIGAVAAAAATPLLARRDLVSAT